MILLAQAHNACYRPHFAGLAAMSTEDLRRAVRERERDGLSDAGSASGHDRSLPFQHGVDEEILAHQRALRLSRIALNPSRTSSPSKSRRNSVRARSHTALSSPPTEASSDRLIDA